MAARQEVIHYPHPGMGTVEVELLSAERAVSLVPLLLNVLEAAYMRQFEKPSNPWLPPGTVAIKHAATPKNCERFSELTASHYEPQEFGRGSDIVVVHPATRYKGHYLRSLAKVSPALRAMKGEFDGCYLNNIASMVTGVGFASIALHAALAKTGYDQNATLTLEGFTDSPVNKLYEGLGMEPTAFTNEYKFDEDNVLPMVCYRTPPGAGVGDVVAALEAKRPYLAESW